MIGPSACPKSNKDVFAVVLSNVTVSSDLYAAPPSVATSLMVVKTSRKTE